MKILKSIWQFLTAFFGKPKICATCIFAEKHRSQETMRRCTNPDSPKKNAWLWIGDNCNHHTTKEKRK